MRFMGAIALVAVLAMLLSGSEAAAQWLNVPRAALPRTADGQPDLKAPAPRRPDGKPDLTGIWRSTDNKYLRNLAADMNPDDVPYQPWAKALFEARKGGAHSREDPDAHCLPQGVPKIDSVAYPWKIIQTPNSYVFVYETFTYWRQIFTDGRTVDPDANPTWMGYSTGRWDGDAFVVDTRGFNGKVWLDQLGRPSTDRLHVIERFTRPDMGRLVIDVTSDDPGRLHAALVGTPGDLPPPRLGTARVHLRREQPRRREAARREPRGHQRGGRQGTGDYSPLSGYSTPSGNPASPAAATGAAFRWRRKSRWPPPAG